MDLTDAYLPVPIHPRSGKYLRFMFEDQVFQFMAIPFRMSLSLWIFTKLMDVNAEHLHQSAIPLFPYLDNWLIRDLIHSRLVSHTIYCLQTVQSQGFIPNLKKSDLIPSQKFTFIEMEFQTQQNIVRVPADRVDSLLLIVPFSGSSFGTNFPFSFGQTQCSSRLHSSRQTTLTTASNVSVICLETSHSSFRSSGSDQQHDSIPFEMVDTNRFILERPFILQIPIHSSLRMPVIMNRELISSR